MMNTLYKEKPCKDAYVDGPFEVCVSCHQVTDIPVNMEIHQRYGYVEGSGQLCKDCYREIYGNLR